MGDTLLFVCAGGENELLTFGRGKLVKNNSGTTHKKLMALFNVVQEPAMFFHSLEGL